MATLESTVFATGLFLILAVGFVGFVLNYIRGTLDEIRDALQKIAKSQT